MVRGGIWLVGAQAPVTFACGHNLEKGESLGAHLGSLGPISDSLFIKSSMLVFSSGRS